MSIIKLLGDRDGSILVETTLVLPIVLLVTLGAVDGSYMLYDWVSANKAAYVGARTAIVSNPVATGITSRNGFDPTLIGEPCFNSVDGTANGNCAYGAVETVCTPDASNSGTCSDGSVFDNSAFCQIFTGDPACPSTPVSGSMKAVFPRLQRQNVQISYETNGLGFVGRPDGLLMDVTVSIRCMTHQFFFISALMGWAFSPLPQGCPAEPSGPEIPAFASTLISEDMATN